MKNSRARAVRQNKLLVSEPAYSDKWSRRLDQREIYMVCVGYEKISSFIRQALTRTEQRNLSAETRSGSTGALEHDYLSSAVW
jgi:hypothetical protein